MKSKSFSRRDFLRLSALTAAGAALAGCARPTEAPPAEVEEVEPTAVPEPTEAPTPAPPEKATIEFWWEPPGGGEAASCTELAVVDPFNEQSETVSVKVVSQPNAWDAIRTALAGGVGPDIVDTPGPSFVYELVLAEQLLALDPLADEFGWGELFLPWALSLGEVEGQLYSLADELETLILYYNKTLFEEHGWEPPNTMDELVVLCEKMVEADVIPFAHANADWRPGNEWYVGEWLNQVAGPQKVYEALRGERPWTDPDFVRAIELLNDMQQNGWFMGGLEFYYTTLWDDWHFALARGEAAMNIEGTWSAFDINDYYFTEEGGEEAAANEWDWIAVPSATGDAIFDIGMGHTWSVNSRTEHPRACGEFLTYFFSPETQARRFRDCGLAPAPVRLKADAMEGVEPRIARIFEEFSEASEIGNYGYTTWTFWPPKSDVYIYEEIEKVWAGDITAEEYLQGLQEIFDEELAAGEIPPLPTR